MYGSSTVPPYVYTSERSSPSSAWWQPPCCPDVAAPPGMKMAIT